MNDVLIPVPFRDDTLTLIDHGGEPYVAMRPIVELIGLAWGAQTIKLTTGKLASVVSMIETTGSDGKRYEMLCLPLRKIPAYLYSIDANKVRADLRETVLTYQDECDEVLWRHWSGHVSAEHAKALRHLQQAENYWFAARPHWRRIRELALAGWRYVRIALVVERSVDSVRRAVARMKDVGLINPADLARARYLPATAESLCRLPKVDNWGRAPIEPGKQLMLVLDGGVS
jgi:hypothetical protein